MSKEYIEIDLTPEEKAAILKHGVFPASLQNLKKFAGTFLGEVAGRTAQSLSAA